MRAAIYARKSTSQESVAEEQKSCTRQIEQARAYAARKGWVVVEDCVFHDEVSGAEFAKRPGFIRLMNALSPRPLFDALIMSEESRLGREAIETAYALKQIVTAGVRVFFYLEDRERLLQGPTDKLLMSVAAFADELERERARQRTYDALSRKAKAGHVTGGRVFGYDNITITLPTGQRSHVERRINEPEAAIVRRVFELANAGLGLRAIAVRLNDALTPSPRPQLGRPRGWTPSTVREVLYRELYRGVIVWNQSKKRDDWGRKRQRQRAESEWIRQPADHLRIVSDDAWQAAHASLARRRTAYLGATGGARHGRPVAKPSKYLLTGFVECGQCHGSLVVRTNSRKGRGRVPGLACWNYMTRGKSVCTNNTEAPLAPLNELVLNAIRDRLLAPAVVEMAIHLATQTLHEAATTRDQATETAALTLKALDIEAARLVDLQVAGVGDLPAVVTRLKAIKSQRDALTRLMDATAPDRTIAEIERLVRERVQYWRHELTANPTAAKPILEGVLSAKIVVTPEARGTYDVRLPLTASGILINALAPKALASPTGFEPVF